MCSESPLNSLINLMKLKMFIDFVSKHFFDGLREEGEFVDSVLLTLHFCPEILDINFVFA